MMDFNELSEELTGLTVFRSLLGDTVIAPLRQLIHAVADGLPIRVPYAEFTAALYKYTDNLTDYITTAVLENENVYLLRRARGQDH